MSPFDHYEKAVELQYEKLNAISSLFIQTVLLTYGWHDYIKGSSGSNACAWLAICMKNIMYSPSNPHYSWPN